MSSLTQHLSMKHYGPSRPFSAANAAHPRKSAAPNNGLKLSPRPIMVLIALALGGRGAA